MTRSDKTDALKKRFLTLLEQKLGVVTDACRAASISRQTYYQWRKEDAEFAKLADDVNSAAIDYVESKLLSTIKEDNNVTAMIFYLKARGGEKWREQKQVDVTSGGLPIAPVISVVATMPIVDNEDDDDDDQ